MDYKECLEKARKAYNEYKESLDKIYDKTSDVALMLSGSIGALEAQFPELKDSEDEKMRKAIVKLVKSNKGLHFGIDNYDDVKWEDMIAWLEKQREQKPADKIQLGKKYKCIASPRYTTFTIGRIYKPEDKFLCSMMNLCSDCFEPVEDGEQKPAWSEDDQKMMDAAREYIMSYHAHRQCVVNWLDGIKDRLTK